MFQGLFKRAERSIDQAVSRIVARVMVAAPLLVAAGFATTAVTVKLVELYGSVVACGIMAAVFVVISLITMALVGVGNSAPAAEAKAAEEKLEDSASPSKDEPSGVEDLLTPEMRSVFASAAPIALPGMLRLVGRNLPLLFILAVAAFIISRFGESSDNPEASADDDEKPAETEPDPAMAAATTAAAAAAAA
jgi:Na+-transporting methylmalonyl-CoA/oxaloacetate decarboxylase gamma subunit